MSDKQTSMLLNRLATDQKTVAEHAWRERSQARVAQAPCDVGLFSDDAKQAELFTNSNRERK